MKTCSAQHGCRQGLASLLLPHSVVSPHVPGRDIKGISKLPLIQLILPYKISNFRGSLEIPLISLAQDAGGHVPRINQLDAATLDEELLSSFHEQISEAFRYFLRLGQLNKRMTWAWVCFCSNFPCITFFRNPLDIIGPELDTLVRCVLWRFTVLDQGSSIGQGLLGIKFSSTSSSWRLWILAATDIISNYLSQRQSLVIKSLPGSEETKFYIQHKLNILLSTAVLYRRS